ncbi:MAG: universal stress protein [Verrucomicrobiota bacterium]|jgi:nucleotide-binding universal stress UspA family protein|nr:universal stress protein [Verrucomicrobiota bacterium]MDD8045328.1 universal stress protein [Verrucomicrobiota bacterium]MDD8051248.1 universal stress protein [Verrucomicrobiota bacterium]MDI9384283.1 universal stress protein [Verrucomicrobiota bacterium]
MNRIRTILVGVDFSETGALALEYAVGLAKLLKNNAKLVLVHVLEPVPAPADSTWAVDLVELERQMEESATNRLKSLAEELSQKEGLVVRTEFRRGVPYRGLLEAVQDLMADLLVLGTHGRTGLSHMFLGSTAERTVRHASCPVLTIRHRGEEQQL